MHHNVDFILLFNVVLIYIFLMQILSSLIIFFEGMPTLCSLQIEFPLLSWKIYLFILDTSPLISMIWNSLSHCTGYLLTILFSEEKHFNFDEVQFIFFLLFLCFSYLRNPCLIQPRSHRFSPIFSFRNFIILAFTFRPLIYIKLICVIQYEVGLQIHSSVCGWWVVVVSRCWKGYSFPTESPWHPCWKPANHTSQCPQILR